MGQPLVGTSPNHFYLGLIEVLEYKWEHILEVLFLYQPFSHLYHKCLPLLEIMELDQGVSGMVMEVVGPVSHEIQGTDGFVWHHCGDLLPKLSSLDSELQSQLKQSFHSYLAFTSQPHPLRICQHYTMKGPTIPSWL